MQDTAKGIGYDYVLKFDQSIADQMRDVRTAAAASAKYFTEEIHKKRWAIKIPVV
jgi:hypothetical protein